MTRERDLLVKHKLVETEPKEFESERELESEQELVSKQELVSQPAQSVGNGTKPLPRKQLQGWLPPLLIGTGLGVAIALAGTRLVPRPPAQPASPVGQNQSQPVVMSVTAAPVQSTRITRTLNVTGTVAARDLIAVLPQTTGLQIKQILVDEGDRVKAGQVMAVLDNSVLQAQISQLKAEVESNQAVVGQRQAALAQSRASLAEAERTLERNQQLANAGAISRQELDTRATAAATATEAVRVAQANINSAQADVRSSIAQLQQLQTQLAQTQVRAPSAGIVAEKNVEIGNVAGTQQLFSIIQNGALELQAQVPAIQLPQVRIGSPAQITSDSDRRVRLQGRVEEIAPLVNNQSRQATVKINMPQTSLLRPGMFARAAINTTTGSGITVPAKAVLPQADGNAIVFVLSGEDKVRATPVQVGEIINGGQMEIKNGLKLGDRVVVAGAGYLKDGDRVQVVDKG